MGDEVAGFLGVLAGQGLDGDVGVAGQRGGGFGSQEAGALGLAVGGAKAVLSVLGKAEGDAGTGGRREALEVASLGVLEWAACR